MAPLSASQIWACVLAERISASVSVCGILMMFTVFYFAPNPKRFQTLSNTLLIYASFANLGSNVAALMGGSGLYRVDSPLCQAQAFLLEWFMQTDPLWGTCMACNVYLVIFHRWTAPQVRSLFKYYLLLCYMIPMVPAIVCLTYSDKQHGRMYGNAGIWCWIDDSWADIRIYSYYLPVWIEIAMTFSIYSRVGFEIFRKRSALRAFGPRGHTHTSLNSTTALRTGNRNSRSSVASRSFNLPSFTGTRTTEVEVTSTPNNAANSGAAHSRPSTSQKEGNFVDITASEKQEDACCKIWDIPRDWYNKFRSHFESMDKVKLAYTKCALLFACSIVVTWGPSSANRVTGLTFGAVDPSFPLNVAAAAVLPLQGFWNTAIFFWTSWSTIKLEYTFWRHKKALQRAQKEGNLSSSQHDSEERGQRGPSITYLGERPVLEIESTREDSEEEDTRNTLAEDVEKTREDSEESDTRNTLAKVFENTTMNDDEAAISAQGATFKHATRAR